MANRRMFSLEIVDTDAFLDMPASTRLLYYDLGMRADDDGFLQNAQKIARYTGAGADDLRLLAAKGYIIPFETGIVVIRHWHANNQIRKDRYKPTICSQEKAVLTISNNGAYERLSVWQPNGNHLETQSRIGQLSSEEDTRTREASPPAPPASEMQTLRANHQHAEQLIRRYGLPDNDPTLEAVLEDAEKHGWEKLETALQTAALSNSRQKISVVFYRSILTAIPKEDAHARADPYANYERF